jgi:hypothetical protein
MIVAIIAFLILTGLFWVGISYVRTLNNKERWRVAKTLMFAGALGIMSILCLMIIAILF